MGSSEYSDMHERDYVEQNQVGDEIAEKNGWRAISLKVAKFIKCLFLFPSFNLPFNNFLF